MDPMSIFVLINVALFLVGVVLTIIYAFLVLVVLPPVLSRSFKKQGILGPKYRFFYGNNKEIEKMKRESQLSILDPSSNDVFSRIAPHYQRWMSQYGETFLYWHGAEPRICISDPELAKNILLSKLGLFVKAKTSREIVRHVGMKGLVYVEGDDWVRHRRILNPAFSIDNLKVMTNVMVDRTLRMFEEWRKGKNAENVMNKEMYSEFKRLTMDILAMAAFGSNYTEGIEALRSHEELRKSALTPGIQYLNFRKKKLERKIMNSVKKIVKSRTESKQDLGDDLLGTMLKSCDSGKAMSIEDIVDECKTFFFEGHETSANMLTWTVMLLSLHQDWQEKIREEVFNECGKDKIPDSDNFPKLKLMNMVIMESLRLYGPVAFMSREAAKELELGHIVIPMGTTVILPLLKIQTDKSIWGSDADKFNPTRFENGVSEAANHPNAFLAFSIGKRACIGQNFAMIEAKTVLVMILQRFRLNLSSEYKHAPVYNFNVQPQFGLPVMLQPLEEGSLN